VDERIRLALALLVGALCVACAGCLDHPETRLPWEPDTSVTALF